MLSNRLLYAITVLIWGSTWFAIEFQLGVVAPEVSLVYRYAAAALLLFGWCRYRGLRLRFRAGEHLWFALLGLLLFGLNYVLAYRAQMYVTSALTAIAFSAIVWMNIVNARLIFGARISGGVLFGAALGIGGILTLFLPQIGDLSRNDSVLIGSLLALGGALIASFGNMASQAAQKVGLPVVQSNAWGMCYGALFNAGAALLSGHRFTFDYSAGYLISLGYLSVFGSIVAFGAYLTLLGRIDAHRAGYATVMFPVVALIMSALFEDLRINATLMIGTTLVLAGNLFVLGADQPRMRQKDNTIHRSHKLLGRR